MFTRCQVNRGIQNKIHLSTESELSSDGSSIDIELDFLEPPASPAFLVTPKSLLIVFINNLDTTFLSDIEASSPIADCN